MSILNDSNNKLNTLLEGEVLNEIRYKVIKGAINTAKTSVKNKLPIDKFKAVKGGVGEYLDLLGGGHRKDLQLAKELRAAKKVRRAANFKSLLYPKSAKHEANAIIADGLVGSKTLERERIVNKVKEARRQAKQAAKGLGIVGGIAGGLGATEYAIKKAMNKRKEAERQAIENSKSRTERLKDKFKGAYGDRLKSKLNQYGKSAGYAAGRLAASLKQD